MSRTPLVIIIFIFTLFMAAGIELLATHGGCSWGDVGALAVLFGFMAIAAGFGAALGGGCDDNR